MAVALPRGVGMLRFALLALAGCSVLSGIDGYVDQAVVGAGKQGAGGGGGGGAGGESVCPGVREGGCKLVYVTEKAYEAKFGGPEKADELCAVEGGKPAVAWLSSGATNAISRIPDAPGGYCLSDGTRVADCKAELAGGKLHAPINRSAKGAPVNEAWVWTGTSAAGQNAPKGNCDDWKSTDAEGVTGFDDLTGKGWTEDAHQPCAETMAHFYCFQQ